MKADSKNSRKGSSPDKTPETPNPPQIMDPNSSRERKKKKAPISGKKGQERPKKKEVE